MLEVVDLQFAYERPVLKGISFTVQPGELLSVLGPNGSGKSTLLKILVRLLDPSGGSVLFDGRDIVKIRRRETSRLIGYVPQESSVRFPLTAMEFVLQGRFAHGRLIGFETEADIAAARWAMELTETVGFSSRRISSLSGGERQRVMLARALAARPRLLVLDEAVANLDISHQIHVLQLVRELTETSDIASIVVTHELNLAAEFATRVLLLKAGEVVGHGHPRQVLCEAAVSELFDTPVLVDSNPLTGAPRITPLTTSGGKFVNRRGAESAVRRTPTE